MNPPRPKLPGPVLAGLVLAVALDTVIQITWKRAVGGVPDNAPAGAAARGALASPYFWVAMMAFAAQLANWLRVLARADLSFAQPFTALSYVTVLALSHLLLHEHLSAGRMGGVGLILTGVFLISRTPSTTVVTP
jgi:drug/metabolite transporter (DMT)-like permease